MLEGDRGTEMQTKNGLGRPRKLTQNIFSECAIPLETLLNKQSSSPSRLNGLQKLLLWGTKVKGKRIFCLEENSTVQHAAAVIRNQNLFLETCISNSLICCLIGYTTVGKQCLNNSFHPLFPNIVSENGMPKSILRSSMMKGAT